MGNPSQELVASGFDELVHCDDQYFLERGWTRQATYAKTIEELWAAREFAKADFCDACRTAHLVSIALTFANKPAASIPEACSGWAETKAAYRLSRPWSL